jgi:hypothetical protein
MLKQEIEKFTLTSIGEKENRDIKLLKTTKTTQSFSVPPSPPSLLLPLAFPAHPPFSFYIMHLH